MSDNDVNAHGKHEADRHRFIIEVDGEIAGFAEYAPTATGDVRDAPHCGASRVPRPGAVVQAY